MACSDGWATGCGVPGRRWTTTRWRHARVVRQPVNQDVPAARGHLQRRCLRVVVTRSAARPPVPSRHVRAEAEVGDSPKHPHAACPAPADERTA